MENKIELCGWGESKTEVNSNMPYSQRAKIMIESSKKLGLGGRRKKDRDDKFSITKEGLASLIGAGAKILELNALTCSKDYISQVIYKNRTFIHGSSTPVPYVIEACLR